MEVKVGILHSTREVSVETDESAQQVTDAFTKALADDGILTLLDQRGRKVLIPAAQISYLDLDKEHARRVGFGAV